MVEADTRTKIVIKWDTCSSEDEGISFYAKDGSGAVRGRHRRRSGRRRDEWELTGRRGTEGESHRGRGVRFYKEIEA